MERIDPAQWKRKEISDFFGKLDFPFYGVTFRVDVTHLYARAKALSLPVYDSLIYASMRAINGVDAFSYKLRGTDVVRHAVLSPSFTVPDGELFKIVHLDWLPAEGMADFCRRSKEAAAAQTGFINYDEEIRDDLVYISCLPWLDFSMITQEMAFDREDSIPRLTWGQIVENAGKRTMAYSVQVNHRLVDGVHLGAFAQALQRELDSL